MRFWQRQREDPEPPIYVGSHEDRLHHIRPLHFTPDDEGRTRSDQTRAEAYDRVDRFPWGGWHGRKDR